MHACQVVAGGEGVHETSCIQRLYVETSADLGSTHSLDVPLGTVPEYEMIFPRLSAEDVSSSRCLGEGLGVSCCPIQEAS